MLSDISKEQIDYLVACGDEAVKLHKENPKHWEAYLDRVVDRLIVLAKDDLDIEGYILVEYPQPWVDMVFDGLVKG